MDVDKVKVGLIGSGNISYTYLNTLTQFSIIEMVGCSDLIPEKSKARAETFGIRQMTTDEILADPEIEIVVNTTELFNHNKVTRMALEAGSMCTRRRLWEITTKVPRQTMTLQRKRS